MPQAAMAASLIRYHGGMPPPPPCARHFPRQRACMPNARRSMRAMISGIHDMQKAANTPAFDHTYAPPPAGKLADTASAADFAAARTMSIDTLPAVLVACAPRRPQR